MVHYCRELECSDEQEEDDKEQMITNDMEHDVIPVTISQSVPITSVTTVSHDDDHNLSLPTHHHHQDHYDHHNVMQQHSSNGVCTCVCTYMCMCVCVCTYVCVCVFVHVVVVVGPKQILIIRNIQIQFWTFKNIILKEISVLYSAKFWKGKTLANLTK